MDGSLRPQTFRTLSPYRSLRVGPQQDKCGQGTSQWQFLRLVCRRDPHIDAPTEPQSTVMLILIGIKFIQYMRYKSWSWIRFVLVRDGESACFTSSERILTKDPDRTQALSNRSVSFPLPASCHISVLKCSEICSHQQCVRTLRKEWPIKALMLKVMIPIGFSASSLAILATASCSS